MWWLKDKNKKKRTVAECVEELRNIQASSFINEIIKTLVNPEEKWEITDDPMESMVYYNKSRDLKLECKFDSDGRFINTIIGGTTTVLTHRQALGIRIATTIAERNIIIMNKLGNLK